MVPSPPVPTTKTKAPPRDGLLVLFDSLAYVPASSSSPPARNPSNDDDDDYYDVAFDDDGDKALDKDDDEDDEGIDAFEKKINNNVTPSDYIHM